MKVNSLTDLPPIGHCNVCGDDKPVADMVVQHHKKEQYYYLRPRCKSCHNARERNHRREWKRNYLRKWRKRNPELNRSYWLNDAAREKARCKKAENIKRNREALAIQRRLRRRGQAVSLAEARVLLQQYGRCYPTKKGLSRKGLQECERIRSLNRRKGKQTLSSFEIRLMVYADALLEGHHNWLIKPDKQEEPYPKIVRNMKLRQSTKTLKREEFTTSERPL